MTTSKQIWTLKHIEDLKAKGKIKDFIDSKPLKPLRKKVKQSEKFSYEKEYIKNYLLAFCSQRGYTLKHGKDELKFAENRRFRFDYAIIELKVAVEYEGIYSRKSRHTTQEGYNRDTEKYNIATSLGWKTFRYTAKTYQNIINDIN